MIEDALRKLGVETRLGAGVAFARRIRRRAGRRRTYRNRNRDLGGRHSRGTARPSRSLRNVTISAGCWSIVICASFGAPGVFATGDAARAACDDDGNYALMSCQHATRMGAFAGNNAAAELLGVPTKPYHQKGYVTCLDLGEAGALFTTGWDRKVKMVEGRRQEDQAGDQHRLDLSAEGRARRSTCIG